MNTWKTNLEDTKRHYIDWWQHKGTIVNMWEHFQQGVAPHADIPAPEPPRDNHQRWFDPEWRARYLDWYVAHSCLKADILPVANTQLGPGSLAAILGGRFEGGDDTIWIHPDPDFRDDITFDDQHPNYQLHKDLLRACKQLSQGHYYVGMPDLMEGLDVLAALKGTDQVLIDTVMQPEVVERQMQQINDIYFRVFDELYDIIREGDEMAFCYFSAWAPGKMTKLQSDISTMISEDDYRRFVQPFIREQCQRIPYTLYHLDGVGAIRHLTALLEIEELNAIQWTPGVGEPQGGSAKWYDLYRRILDGGKSVLCSWVTLDELPRLLDAIGTDGVHLEMDFHDENEVEQALDIVERARQKGRAAEVQQVDTPVRVSPSFGGSWGEAPLLLDGAMGTMIQQYRLGEADFRGQQFKDHPTDLKGCNDLLTLTRPDIIADIHRRYLGAGADIIETCTFNAQRISLADYGLQAYVRDINLAACRIARAQADAFSDTRRRYVAGSIGPTNKTITPTSDASLPLRPEMLAEAYREQIEALIDGGVDALLIETIFDVENARVCIDTARQVMEEKQRQLPVMLSFVVSTPDGHNMLGQDILDFIRSVELKVESLKLNVECQESGPDIIGTVSSCPPPPAPCPSKNAPCPLFSVGVNCHADVAAIAPLIRRMARELPYRISLYPNAGHPDANGRYAKTPEQLAADLAPLIDDGTLDIVGGCCGTTDAHIAFLAGVFRGKGQGARGVAGGKGHGARGRRIVGNMEQEASESLLLDDISPAPCPPPPAPKKSYSPAPCPPPPAPQGVAISILHGREQEAVEAVRQALADGADPQRLIDDEMIAAMTQLGQLFEEGKAFVPQLLMAGRAMKAAMQVVRQFTIDNSQLTIHNSQLTIHNSQFTIDNSTLNTQHSTFGTVLIGTVKGDLHDIGKNLVAAMLEGVGFRVVNIGIDVSAQTFIDEVKKHQPDVLALSALLTTTMPYMREVIDALEREGIRQQVKVIVGGAPVSQRFADEIGADGYSDNANSAVALVKKLLKR